MPTEMFATLLDAEWEEGAVGNRVKKVPKPYITAEKVDKRHDLDTAPLCVVTNGGSRSQRKYPQDGYYHLEENFVNVELECIDTHVDKRRVDTADTAEEYMRGYHAGPDGNPDAGLDPYEREEYGGLVGEVTRVVHKYHDGVGGYDTFSIENVDDQSGEAEYGNYRVVVEVKLNRTNSPAQRFYGYDYDY